MGIQPSASRTSLLLLCPRPFDPEIEEDEDLPGEPARYGTAFHSVIAACLRTKVKKGTTPFERSDLYPKAIDRAAKKHDIRGARDELAGHVKSSVKVLRNWLERQKLQVVDVERAYAIKPERDGTWGYRPVDPHDQNHKYDIADDEMGATVDLMVADRNRYRVVVIDHKTGGGDGDTFAQPVKMGQMRTLGLIATGGRKVTRETEVGIFHADRRGLPIVYAEPYEKKDQKKHASALYAAIRRIGQGFLRPGPHCGRCKARDSCPAHAADLLSESTTVLVESSNQMLVEPIDPKGLLRPPDNNSTIETRAGAMYEMLKRFRALEKAATDEIKRLVRAGAVIETRDGRVLTLQTQTYEMISKKSILEGLGKIAGERMLNRLREQGAMRDTSREMIVPEK